MFLILTWLCLLSYNYYGEALYFLRRLDLMILGLKPHRDFAFVYGPGLIYPPYFAYLSGILTIEQSYCLTLISHWLAGLFCICYIIRSLGHKCAQAAIFTLVSLACANLSLGLNYTPLRFALPVASVFAFHRFACKAHSPRSWIISACLSFLLPLANLAVSPEIGIAVCIAILAYLIVLLRTSLRGLSIGIPFVAASLLASAFLFGSDYFRGMSSFTKGGANFPIFPSVFILIFLTAVFVILPPLAVIACTQKTVAGAAGAAFFFLFGLLIPPPSDAVMADMYSGTDSA